MKFVASGTVRYKVLYPIIQQRSGINEINANCSLATP